MTGNARDRTCGVAERKLLLRVLLLLLLRVDLKDLRLLCWAGSWTRQCWGGERGELGAGPKPG